MSCTVYFPINVNRLDWLIYQKHDGAVIAISIIQLTVKYSQINMESK